MTVISSTSAAAGTGSGEGKKTGAMQILGKDAFLQLLVTQLRHQDPLSPQDNSAFVAQMAQFTSLEQMQNLNAQMSLLLELYGGAQAPALLGRLVSVSGEGGAQYSGRVEALEYNLGKPLLVIDGKRFGLESLLKVFGGDESGS